MTNTHFDEIDAFRDIESLNHYAEVTAAGEDPGDDAGSAAEDEPRQRAHADAVGRGRARRLHQRRAVDPGQRELRGDQRRGGGRDSDSVFHHYRRLIALRHTEPVVAHGEFTMLLEDDERVYAFTRRLGDDELLVLGNFSGEDAPVELEDSGGELVLGNYEDAGEPGVLRPWETRVLRR